MKRAHLDPIQHWTAVNRPRLVAQFGSLVVEHSERFRKVSNRYPNMVAQAYGRDLAAAVADSDEQVAARVAAWERANGWPVRDWPAIGAWERDEAGDDDDDPA